MMTQTRMMAELSEEFTLSTDYAGKKELVHPKGEYSPLVGVIDAICPAIMVSIPDKSRVKLTLRIEQLPAPEPRI